MTDPVASRGTAPPDLFAARVRVTRDRYARLVQEFHVDVGCRPHVEANPDGTGSLQIFASAAQIQELRAAGFEVDQGENASELGRKAQAEIGKGDRFEGGRVTPRGLGRKPGRDGGTTGGAAR